MENILIDTDIAIEYLRSKDKGSTELVRLLRNHVIHVYCGNVGMGRQYSLPLDGGGMGGGDFHLSLCPFQGMSVS